MSAEKNQSQPDVRLDHLDRLEATEPAVPITDGILKLYDSNGRLLAESEIKDGQLWRPVESERS